MKGIAILSLILASLLIAPAFAQTETTYDVTLGIILPNGEVVVFLRLNDVANMTLNIPQALYNLIVQNYGTDTFTAPCNITFIRYSVPLALMIVSDPPGWTVTFVPMSIPDADGNGVVGLGDLVLLAKSYGSSLMVHPPDGYNLIVDFNFDLRVDLNDLVTLAIHWGKTS